MIKESGADQGYLEQTRRAYDTVAASYAELVPPRFDTLPLDQAMLDAFAGSLATVTAADPRSPLAGDAPGAQVATVRPRVADVGCGPGHVTSRLAALGLDAFGLDLSPAMVAIARDRHPHLDFRTGSMTALDLLGDSLHGIVSWYSLIHVKPADRPAVLAGFHRVLRAGGRLMLAFQVGDEARQISQGYGHAVSLVAYRLLPERIQTELAQAGFEVDVSLIRSPVEGEKVHQAVLVARKLP